MPTLTMEIGKLMAQVDILKNQLVVIQKDIAQTKKQITDVHTELLNFMTTVQQKSVCQALHERIQASFVPRSELAPIKAVAGMIVLTTVTALSAAFFNLILK